MTTCRKGDIVAVAVDHSYTGLREGTMRRITFELREVTSVTRKGEAKTVRYGGISHGEPVERVGDIRFISTPGLQAAARRLFDRMSYPPVTWETAEAIKSAIVAEASLHGYTAPITQASPLPKP